MHIKNSLINIFDRNLKQVEVSSIYEWAKHNISLPSSYSEPGIFNIHKSNYLIEPLNAMLDNKIRNVIIYKSVQTGGTLLADLSIPYFIINRPGPVLFSMYSEKMIKDHLNDRLYPLFQNCKSLRNILPTLERDFTNYGIKFPHCTLYCDGQAESTFQAKSIKFLICDEVHLWQRGRLDQALTRTSAFDVRNTSKRLIISQPGQTDDDLDNIYRSGTMEEWHVPCESCGKYFIPNMREQRKDGSYFGLLWDSNEITKPNDKWNYVETIKTIKLICEGCGHAHIDSKKLKDYWNKNGKYIQMNDNPDVKTRSFRWNSLIKSDWCDIVLEFLNAKALSDIGIYQNLTNFFQQRMARPYDPTISDIKGFMKTDVYDVVSDWAEAIVRLMIIDNQKESFWVNIREWAADGKSRQLYFGQCFTYDEINNLIIKFKIAPELIFVDAAWSDKEEGRHRTWDFINKHGFTGLRGDNKNDLGWKFKVHGKEVTSFVDIPKPIPGGTRFFFNFAPNALRDILADLRDGNSHEFKSLDNDIYKKQMFSEKHIPRKDHYGNIKWVWVPRDNVENHAWDLEVMGLAAVLLTRKVSLIPNL